MKTRFIDVGVFSVSMTVVPIVASVLIYIQAHIVVHIRTFQRHLKVIRYFFVWNIWFFITNVSIFSMIINFKFHNIIQCAMCNVNEQNTSVFEINSMREILYAFISVIFACYLRLQCVCFFSLRLFIAPKILRYFIKNIFVLSFGKSLSIGRMKDFLHHTNNSTKEKSSLEKSLLVHFSLTNIKLT